jgi:hypothetical protein
MVAFMNVVILRMTKAFEQLYPGASRARIFSSWALAYMGIALLALALGLRWSHPDGTLVLYLAGLIVAAIGNARRRALSRIKAT